MAASDYSFPVFGTQGGGLVREIGTSGIYIFVEKPDCPGLDVGDYMPSEWGIAPANELANENLFGWEHELDMDSNDGLIIQSEPGGSTFCE